jgi:hypothetical protein
MTTTDFKNYLKQEFPEIKFYVGTINKNDDKCVGVYPRGNVPPNIALGGVENTSYSKLPVTLIVHWTQNSSLCEDTANSIYARLFGASGIIVEDIRVISIEMLDSAPISLGRDENSICEMTIRLNIIYER